MTMTNAHARPALRERPFKAVISDMDGVLTRTATLHEQAWKETFDAFLGRREGQRPFSHSDYRAHVDGKPRYDGAADFLASRGIELPRGAPTDAADRPTACGLGNRKDELFLELLGRVGVDVWGDATAAIERWKRGGMKLAAISASRNCRRVLRAADLERRFDAIVGGEVIAERGLEGKADIMLEAARQLGVSPEDAVILEDATAGVRAARSSRFGLVVGVSRHGYDDDLYEAGAHVVVRVVTRARFLRSLPSALDRLEELSAWRGGRPLSVFLDYDGTLTPIVDHPRDARMSDEMRSVVRDLAERWPVVIISGRDREDVATRVGIPGLVYAGNHGFDIAGPGVQRTPPEAEQALGEVDRAEAELRRRLERLDGVVIERKRFSIAVHFRMVESDCSVDHVRRAVASVRGGTSLRQRSGKRVLELEPALDWDKGRALLWLLDAMREGDGSFALCIGDDETDEDAFAALEGRGAGVRVGEETTTSLADYRAGTVEEVQRLLGALSASVH